MKPENEQLIESLLNEKSKIKDNLNKWEKATSLDDTAIGLNRSIKHNIFMDNELLGYIDISLVPFDVLRNFFIAYLNKKIGEINNELKEL